MTKKSVPIATRRLTRAEAAKLGVSYTAKQQVPITLKRITSKTKTYSLSQVRAAKLGMSKEKYTLINKIKKHDFKIEPTADWFNNLKSQPFGILRRMADAKTSDEWFDELDEWREDHDADEEPANPFFYH